ncbi:hypothetical protein EsH8_III_000971 [Colletotrichum jinshuiense]
MNRCHGNISGHVNYGTDDYITRLMNSSLQERHLDPRWQYDGPMAANDTFFEVAFAKSSRRQTAWPNDYWFRSVQTRDDPFKSGIAVHAGLAKLARKYYVHVNGLHSFMRFPPARAAVRTLLIELEHAEAQHGPRLDESDIVGGADEIVCNAHPSERQTFLARTTTSGTDFADRALILCLVKLYSHLEAWDSWQFGYGGRRSTLEILLAIIGLFCDAWVHAPVIDISWARLGRNPIPSFLSNDAVNDVGPSSSLALTPEIWFEWSLLFDPWIRRTDATLLLAPDEDDDDEEKPVPDNNSKPAIVPVLVAQVSEPEPDKEGRVVVKCNSRPDEERWAFRALLDSKWTGKSPRTGLMYLVDWEYAESTWQPARDLQGCDSWVLEFHRLHPGKPGPVSRLRRFL